MGLCDPSLMHDPTLPAIYPSDHPQREAVSERGGHEQEEEEALLFATQKLVEGTENKLPVLIPLGSAGDGTAATASGYQFSAVV